MKRAGLLGFVLCAAAWTVVAKTTVTFYGGAGRVGGSCALAQSGATRLLVDCGAFYGGEFMPDEPGGDDTFGFDPASVSDLVLTHAHADHAGRIPKLIRDGFKGTIWMTPPTRALLESSLHGQSRYEPDVTRTWRWSTRTKRRTVHWQEACEWAGRIAVTNRHVFTGTLLQLKAREKIDSPFFCGTCCDLDLKDLMTRVKVKPYDTPWKIGAFTVTFADVKHLPGAASVRLEESTNACVFSGDLGSCRSRLVKTIEPAKKADAVFVETTYGDATLGTPESLEAEYQRFRQVVGETLRTNGVVWIPAFAMDRSQRVLLEIQKGQAAGVIPTNVPVHFISASGREMMGQYVSHPEWFDVPDMKDARDLFDRSSAKFPKKKVARTILVTTSGMMEMGASRRLLPTLLPRTDVRVLLVGYQSPTTPGGLLKNGAKELELDGKKIPVRAKVDVFSCFSGHGDAAENDRWLANNVASRIFLIHGEAKSLEERRNGLTARFPNATVEIVKPGVSYTIGE